MQKIGLIDSGIGGLSVLQSVFNNNNNFNNLKTNFFYLADFINLPYGEKSKENLQKILIQNINLWKCTIASY